MIAPDGTQIAIAFLTLYGCAATILLAKSATRGKPLQIQALERYIASLEAEVASARDRSDDLQVKAAELDARIASLEASLDDAAEVETGLRVRAAAQQRHAQTIKTLAEELLA